MSKDSLRGKHSNDSKSETTIMMLPSDANPKGNVFGGVILKHIDLIAGLVAKRHAGHANVVTASIDRVAFLKPVFIGNALILSARLNYVKRSSMEVEVIIMADDLDSGERTLTGTAFVTVVALDDAGKPVKVTPLILRTEDDRRRFLEGESRMNARLK
ncbi:acyl-CoA thioesterase [Nitrososphaera sp. AFS]|uniref:acyl-CoA thioesterase n=1 Tax=Nitrososphaera sp. AFS TaxID=2301191 RepID=UPI00139240A2|nr:acyl-CoA thioesterase [Nitrososphaera sp. AFS]NAL76915.1 acyl-CoA thioesterase [Nitrososphaera sp. AFS]